MAGLVRSNGAQIPLQSIEANVTLRDRTANVAIRQVYFNDAKSQRAIGARYLFPTPTGAAIHRFRSEIDGVIIEGQVKEKQEAKRTFDAAIARGQSAALLKEEATDVFQAEIGNLDPGKTCTVHIEYVMPVDMNDDEQHNKLRFVLPTTVAPKYTPASTFSASENKELDQLSTTSTPSTSVPRMDKAKVPYRLQVHFDIELGVGIKSVFSPSTAGARLVSVVSSKRQQWFFGATNAWLDQDLVLVVEQLNPFQNVAAIEYDTENKSYAMSVQLAPRPAVTDTDKAQLAYETSFVLDRSGSMEGKPLELLKECMQVCLSSMSTRSLLNVVRFDDRSESLWTEQKPYNATNLAAARLFVAETRTREGGTELAEALRLACSRPSRSTDVVLPRQVFVLTDGQVTNVDELCDIVRARSSDTRVFTFGIGSAVDRNLVLRLASAGRGSATFLLDNDEDFTTKVTLQVNRAMQPALTQVSVDWAGAGFAPITKAMDIQSTGASAPGGPAPALEEDKSKKSVLSSFVQVPSKIPCVFADTPLVLYALGLDADQVKAAVAQVSGGEDGKDKADAIKKLRPQLLITAGCLDEDVKQAVSEKGDSKSVVGSSSSDIKTPVSSRSVIMPDAIVEGQTIHRLAARARILELEAQPDRLTPRVKLEIMQLALRYRLASSQTSFVAVHLETKSSVAQDAVMGTIEVPLSTPDWGVPRGIIGGGSPAVMGDPFAQTGIFAAQGAFGAQGGYGAQGFGSLQGSYGPQGAAGARGSTGTSQAFSPFGAAAAPSHGWSSSSGRAAASGSGSFGGGGWRSFPPGSGAPAKAASAGVAGQSRSNAGAGASASASFIDDDADSRTGTVGAHGAFGRSGLGSPSALALRSVQQGATTTAADTAQDDMNTTLKLLQIRADLLGDQMRSNIDDAVLRGSGLEEIESRSQLLEAQSSSFGLGRADRSGRSRGLDGSAGTKYSAGSVDRSSAGGSASSIGKSIGRTMSNLWSKVTSSSTSKSGKHSCKPATSSTGAGGASSASWRQKPQDLAEAKTSATSKGKATTATVTEVTHSELLRLLVTIVEFDGGWRANEQVCNLFGGRDNASTHLSKIGRKTLSEFFQAAKGFSIHEDVAVTLVILHLLSVLFASEKRIWGGSIASKANMWVDKCITIKQRSDMVNFVTLPM
jgi:uncharacterized protein YegL